MITEIKKNLYRIEVPLKGNPLRVLNCYFIKSDDREVVIDTGFQSDDCYESLKSCLDELGSNEAVRDVIGTHLHADHIGNAPRILGPKRHIYLSKVDYCYMRTLGDSVPSSSKRFLHEGFLKTWVLENASTNVAWKYDVCREPDEKFKAVDDGDIIEVGDYKLKVVLVPGHTPGQMMLWDEADKIMFTGDHVLFDITPNITNWPRIDDSLGHYIDSLKKSLDYPVELALPGHRENGDYHARIKELLKHHDERLKEAYNIIKDNPGLTAVDIASRMTWSIRAKNWDEFPSAQKWYATGECISHLDYMRLRGKIRQESDGDLFHYYLI